MGGLQRGKATQSIDNSLEPYLIELPRKARSHTTCIYTPRRIIYYSPGIMSHDTLIEGEPASLRRDGLDRMAICIGTETGSRLCRDGYHIPLDY